MDFTEEELEFRIRDMEEELKKVKSTEEESKRLKDREEKTLIIAIGKSEKVEQMMITKKDQVSLGSKESDMDQYMDLDEKRLIKKREKKKEKNCWSRERLEAMPGLGIGFCLVTVLLYQCMNIITKKMTTHPFVILFLRDCLLTPQYFPVLIYGKTTPFPKGKMWLLAVRSVIDGIHLMVHFKALQILPLGDVTMIGAVRVVFTNLFSCVFLKEPCGVFEVFNILLVVSGIVLVVQPPVLFGGDSPYTDEMLIMAAVYITSCSFAALCFIIARYLKSVHWAVLGLHSRIFNLIELVVALIATGTFCLPECGVDRLLIVILSVIGSVSSGTLVSGLKYEKAGVIGLVDNAGHLIFSQVFQVIIFKEMPRMLSIVGVFLVLAAVISLGARGLLLEKFKKFKKQETEESESEIQIIK